MTHPLHGSSESEVTFLKRMEDLSAGVGQASVEAEDLQMLVAIARHWRRLETLAAKHVESIVCLRSPRFTGEPPYVGWAGLGIALREDYDERDRQRNDIGILLAQIDFMTKATGENLDCEDAALVEQIRADHRLATNTQSQIEEARSADTGTAEQSRSA